MDITTIIEAAAALVAAVITAVVIPYITVSYTHLTLPTIA